MPRFSDKWVVDRTMFEFVMGGSCACCGMMHLTPEGATGAIQAMSDLETDAANAEINALEYSPWPNDMRDHVWADRLRLRHKMKLEMKQYSKFWTRHGDGFESWLLDHPNPTKLKRLLQIPRTEIMECIGSRYNIHSGFAIVLCAVTEQVANFPVTGYRNDGRGNTELEFENALYYDKRGGFTMDLSHPDTLGILCNRIRSMGGPKLLERNPKKKPINYNDGDDDESTTSNNDDDDDDVDGGGDPQNENPVENGTVAFDRKGKPVASFRLDRRVIRLLIARFWADAFQKRYLQDIIKQKKKIEKAAAANSNLEGSFYCMSIQPGGKGVGGGPPPPPPMVMMPPFKTSIVEKKVVEKQTLKN